MKNAADQRIVREMGLTFEEFMRTLPRAISPLQYSLDGRCIAIAHPSGRIEITLGVTVDRRIASIALPCTPVEFCFIGLSGSDRTHFMERFDLYFHRGGG